MPSTAHDLLTRLHARRDAHNAAVARWKERTMRDHVYDPTAHLPLCTECGQPTDVDEMVYINDGDWICVGCDDRYQSIIMDEIYAELDDNAALDADNAALTWDDDHGFDGVPF